MSFLTTRVFYADGVQERFAGDVFLAARRHGGWLRSVWQKARYR